MADAKDAPREGDLTFDRLYRSSRDDVYAYVAGLLRDATAAEEVTAAAFERAYRKRNRFDPRRGEPRAWLFGIARNAALDELRRRGRQAELTAEPADLGSCCRSEAMVFLRRTAKQRGGLRNDKPRGPPSDRILGNPSRGPFCLDSQVTWLTGSRPSLPRTRRR